MEEALPGYWQGENWRISRLTCPNSNTSPSNSCWRFAQLVIHAMQAQRGREIFRRETFRFEGNKKNLYWNSPFSKPFEKGAPTPSIQSELGEEFNDEGLLTPLWQDVPLSPHLHSPSKTRIEEKERILIDSLFFEPASMYQLCNATRKKKNYVMEIDIAYFYWSRPKLTSDWMTVKSGKDFNDFRARRVYS